MTVALIERPLFKTPPAEDLIKAFRKHVAETGQPETFEFISTTKPPKDGQVVALFHPIDINKAKRPHKDYAPCPICCPDKPKYLSGGTLIWCEGSHAIYAVGPECSGTLWADGRLDRAVNILRQTELAKANVERLKSTIATFPALKTWIANHLAAARQVDEMHAEFAKSAPKVRRAISQALKTGGTGTPILAGAEFTRATWKLAQKLNDIRDGLTALSLRGGADAGEWVDGLSASVVAENFKFARQLLADLDHVAERLNAASRFLADENLKLLGMWANSDARPMDFTATRTGSTVEIRAGQELWRGRVGLPGPAPLPEI